MWQSLVIQPTNYQLQLTGIFIEYSTLPGSDLKIFLFSLFEIKYD